LQRPNEDWRQTLHSLERKGFVRRQRRSSVEGESEFAFAHALVRDVAYGQIPRGELLASGAVDDAAEAEALHAHFLWYRGQRDAAYERLANAEELVASRAGSPAKARILCLAARFRMLAGDSDEALHLAADALALADELGLDELRAHALTTLGSTKDQLPDSDGIPELEDALEIALAANSPLAATTMLNLAVV
jgi:hypothetical protein